LVGCTDDGLSPEVQLRETIEAIATAVEAGKMKPVGENIADDYRDNRHRDKRSALATLYWYLRQHRNIHLFTLVRSLQLDDSGQTARSVVMVAMAGVPIASRASLVSLNADLYRFDVTWRYEEGHWRIAGSEWQRSTLADF
jgi:hypothetical protein